MSTRQHGELPLADYDHLSVGSLEHRIRGLSAEELQELLGYEREHADRTPVVELFTARLDQLKSGSAPSPGGGDFRPEQPGPPSGGPRVTPETSAEPIHPPPHGTPPTGPGKPKGDRP
ncbi:hypothetical protein H1V43_20295 [Streptomyces sp. PSKA54]|uniref:DUF8129 domain-containing protein n=1 Tax=Streptomyces himalayensis subsp. aureolus TaxID=2758039 RepID=A0A7W2D2Q2_9ACTN|nr:hypothetical protein [Streptomyces himalayensis]MBA4863682.1 hypothetical protein [Streptomyces himalayensis subsp. aureolus]